MDKLNLKNYFRHVQKYVPALDCDHDHGDVECLVLAFFKQLEGGRVNRACLDNEVGMRSEQLKNDQRVNTRAAASLS